MANKKEDVKEEVVVLNERDAVLQAPKRKVSVHRDPINKDSHIWVSVNGVDFYLATGKVVEVPEPIAQAYEDSYAETIAAYEKISAENEIK